MVKPVKHGKSYRIRWLDEFGVRQNEIYYDYKTAKTMLDHREHQVCEVKLGMRTGRIPDRQFDKLCDLWQEEYAPTKRSEKDIASILKVHLRPFFGKLTLRFITKRDVQRFRNSRRHLADKTVDNYLILLRSMLREAVEIGWLEKAPRIKISKNHRDERDFRYLRTDREINRFLNCYCGLF